MSCDIVKRLFELLAESLPGISKETIIGIERKINHEFAGEIVRIPKRDREVRAKIAERFNGNNFEELMREMCVSRRTIYRAVQAGRKAQAKNRT